MTTSAGTTTTTTTTTAAAAAVAAAAGGKGYAVGFLGTGTITSAIVNGLCTSSLAPVTKVYITPRSKDKADELKARYPLVVHILEHETDLLVYSDILFLAVRPEQLSEALGPFASVLSDASVAPKPGIQVVSLVATHTRETVYDMLHKPTTTTTTATTTATTANGTDTSGAITIPKQSIARAVPLPTVERHCGVTILFPKLDRVEQLFQALGTCVTVPNETQAAALQSVTCLMGPYYAALRDITNWCKNHQVPEQTAQEFTTAMFHGIAGDAESAVLGGKIDGLTQLINEQTPGGLNQGAIEHLKQARVCDAINDSLDKTLARLTNTTTTTDQSLAATPGRHPRRYRAARWNETEQRARRTDNSLSHVIQRQAKQGWCTMCSYSKNTTMIGRRSLYQCKECLAPLCVRPRKGDPQGLSCFDRFHRGEEVGGKPEQVPEYHPITVQTIKKRKKC